MEIEVNYEFGVRILVSVLIGGAIGFEREYSSKAAGLRTMIMICLGSTILTLVSLVLEENSKDRVASSIVTGVGFLGAGVIFKDGLTVKGLTTASTIWISAALGMAIGAGQYFMALTGSVAVIIILAVLDRIQLVIERLHQVRSYTISTKNYFDFIGRFEKELKQRKIEFRVKRDMKEVDSFVIVYDCSGTEKKLDGINSYLKEEQDVLWYQY
ncbi:MAG TPA: MgtC/SapB family protein [Cyclobacteriaceae bacterium]